MTGRPDMAGARSWQRVWRTIVGARDHNGEQPATNRLFLPVIAAAVFIDVMMTNMVNVVLPTIREDFGVSEAQVGWAVTAYLLVFAIGVPFYGRISDSFSLRKVFSLGLLGFAAGSLICALAPSLAVLIFGRIVQAAGGAAIPALATVAVAKALPPGKRGGAMGLIGSSVGIGIVVGPIVGGVVAQVAGWHSLFYGTVLLTLLLLPGVLYAMPGGGTKAERRFDMLGGILLGLAAGLFLLGITQGQAAGFDSPSSWGCFLGAAVSAVGFVWRITSAADPFVSPALFRNRGYVAAVIVGFFLALANTAAIILVPLLVIEENGLSTGAAGLVLMPGAAAMAVLAPLSGRLSDRIGMRIPILTGVIVMGLSIFFISAYGAGASAILIAVGMLGSTAGFGLANAPTSNAAANSLPADVTGVGLGIFRGIFFLGAGTGPAVIGALLAARRENATDAINPLYALDAAPFSDAFLAVALALLLAFIAAFWLRPIPRGERGAQ